MPQSLKQSSEKSQYQLALVPFHPYLAAPEKNVTAMLELANIAKNHGADLIIFPELALSGYYARDLYYYQPFLLENKKAFNILLHASQNLPALLFGALGFLNDTPTNNPINKTITNNVFLIEHGQIIASRIKHDLPNHDVFDELRYFSQPNYFEKKPIIAPIIKWRNLHLAVMICEELWQPQMVASLANHQADLLITINASPFEKGKMAQRQKLVTQHAHQHQIPNIYVNLCGGMDDLIFDGHIIISDNKGQLLLSAEEFKSEIIYCSLKKTIPKTDPKAHGFKTNKSNHSLKTPIKNFEPESHWTVQLPEEWVIHQTITAPSLQSHHWQEQCYRALNLALTDYMQRNGFSSVVLGLSGGMDSALTMALATDFLGAGQVRAFAMPSRYSSQNSMTDAKKLCQAAGVSLTIIEIEPLYQLFLHSFGWATENDANKKSVSIAAQNLQARIRALILMAQVNKNGGLLLSTGNKSELATGYFTLYGDSCGGYNLLKDLYKTEVYELARWRNQQPQIAFPIQETIFTKAPSAELAPEQKDQDTLPPYELLDKILFAMIEQQGQNLHNYPTPLVNKIEQMLRRAEFKRQQGATGAKLSQKAFGPGWRMPISSNK